MNNYRLLKKIIFAGFLFNCIVFSEIVFSEAIVVDFEMTPTIANAAKTFGRAGPAQIIEVEDGITFKGGVILGLPTFSPTSPFSTPPNLYGTAYHPSGRVIGHPSLSPSLSIDISSSIKATSIEGLLLNGLNRPGSYTIEAFSSDKLIDSLSLNNLGTNFTNGYATFSLESDAQPITSILFSPDLIDEEWDYFIDSISINSPSNSPVPIPASMWFFVSGILGIVSMKITFHKRHYLFLLPKL